METVNPIGRETDDQVGTERSSCRCEIKGTFDIGSSRGGCACGANAEASGQIFHIVSQGH